MNPNELADALVEQLDALPEPRTPPMRTVRRTYSRRVADRAAEFVLNMARTILDRGRYRWIAYELIADHPAAFRSLDRETLEELGEDMEGWAPVDSFARTLSGPAWLSGLIGQMPSATGPGPGTAGGGGRRWSARSRSTCALTAATVIRRER